MLIPENSQASGAIAENDVNKHLRQTRATFTFTSGHMLSIGLGLLNEFAISL